MKNILTALVLLIAPVVFGTEISELTPIQVFEQSGTLRVIDVRTPEEFSAPEGHIKGAKLVTLGPDLSVFLQSGDRKERIVFVCRSGKRSAKAAAESLRLGYEATFSMQGGMLEWTAQGLPTSQN